MPEFYIVKAVDPNARVLRHNRTVAVVQAQMRSNVYCLHPLGITRWGEYNGALWHKRGRISQ